MAWRRMSLMCVSVGSVLLLAGCGGSSEADVSVDSAAASSVTSTAATTTEATTLPPTTTTTPLLPPPSAATAAPTTTLTEVEFERNESYYFVSPDGEFQCGIIKLPNRTEAGCQGATSPVPPKPDSCVVNWGHGIRVENEGEGAFMCSGGVVYTSGEEGGDPVLPAGSQLSKLGYTCNTTEEDVTCVNDETSHGFTIAPDSNTTF
ncbi:MAG: hypothetical protein GX610_19555 [Rhodococcus sp.]|nr:hypothetical protein [Rhodococcus sp. (in: high G+C Gram-positive bacteria)]